MNENILSKGECAEVASHATQMRHTNTQQDLYVFSTEVAESSEHLANFDAITKSPDIPLLSTLPTDANFTSHYEQWQTISLGDESVSWASPSSYIDDLESEHRISQSVSPGESPLDLAPYFAPILGRRGDCVLGELLDNLLPLRAQDLVIAEVLCKLVKEYMDLGSAWDKARTSVDENQARFWADVQRADEDSISLRDTAVFFAESQVRWQRLQKLEELMAWKRTSLESLMGDVRKIDGFDRLCMGDENMPPSTQKRAT